MVIEENLPSETLPSDRGSSYRYVHYGMPGHLTQRGSVGTKRKKKYTKFRGFRYVPYTPKSFRYWSANCNPMPRLAPTTSTVRDVVVFYFIIGGWVNAGGKGNLSPDFQEQTEGWFGQGEPRVIDHELEEARKFDPTLEPESFACVPPMPPYHNIQRTGRKKSLCSLMGQVQDTGQRTGNLIPPTPTRHQTAASRSTANWRLGNTGCTPCIRRRR